MPGQHFRAFVTQKLQDSLVGVTKQIAKRKPKYQIPDHRSNEKQGHMIDNG